MATEKDKWVGLDKRIDDEMTKLGFPKFAKPKKSVEAFPEDVSTLGGHEVTGLMSHYESWAAYTRTLLSKVISRKDITDGIRHRMYTRLIVEFQSKKKLGINEARNQALLDKDIKDLDYRSLEDQIKAQKLREYLETYENYVRILSRELTRISSEGEVSSTAGRSVFEAPRKK